MTTFSTEMTAMLAASLAPVLALRHRVAEAEERLAALDELLSRPLRAVGDQVSGVDEAGSSRGGASPGLIALDDGGGGGPASAPLISEAT